MRELTDAAMGTLGSDDLVAGLTATATVCLALMIWIGLLGRASRATLLWTFALTLALLGSYTMLGSAALGRDVVAHPVGLGILCGMPVVIWSGLRAAQDARSHAWIGFAQSFCSVGVLALTTHLAIGPMVFRLVFLFAGLGAALGAIEVLRGAFRESRFGTPLVVASGILLLLATVGLAGGAAGSSRESDLLLIRAILLATIVYVICATVSLLFLSSRRRGAGDVLEAIDAFLPAPLMRAVVRERLARARVRGEQTWSFIDLRLDDATDLHEATSEAAFAATVRRFEEIVATTFPAEADLCRVAGGHVRVFASLPVSSVRELVRAVLTRVAEPRADAPISLRISASAGIVGVDAATADIDALAAAASAAADMAQRQGGDRWIRAEAPFTAPLP